MRCWEGPPMIHQRHISPSPGAHLEHMSWSDPRLGKAILYQQGTEVVGVSPIRLGPLLATPQRGGVRPEDLSARIHTVDRAHHGRSVLFEDVGDGEGRGLAGAWRPEDQHRFALLVCDETPIGSSDDDAATTIDRRVNSHRAPPGARAQPGPRTDSGREPLPRTTMTQRTPRYPGIYCGAEGI